MRIYLSIKKPPVILWLFLCIVIFLSCLLYPSLLPAENSYTGVHSASLQGNGTAGTEYPDFIHEIQGGESNPFLFSPSSASKRIPLRLPIPHMWISYVLLIYTGLRMLHKQRIQNGNKYGYLCNYMIRYIHDQDGEIYHSSFLF